MVSRRKLQLGEGEGMAQVQDAVHVRIGKIAEKLLFRCAFSRRIHLEYFGISPLGLRRHGWRGIVRSKEGEGCGGTTGVKYTSLTDSRLLWQPVHPGITWASCCNLSKRSLRAKGCCNPNGDQCIGVGSYLFAKSTYANLRHPTFDTAWFNVAQASPNLHPLPR